MIIEEKVVRRVRTPKGVRKFGQPIGTVIVPDAPIVAAAQAISRSLGTIHMDGSMRVRKNSKRTGVLKKVPTDYDGWDKFQDGDQIRYVGKQEGMWMVLDDEDYLVSDEFKLKPDAIRAMHEGYATEFPDDGTFEYTRNSKKPGINMPRQETLDASSLELASSEREIIAHMQKWRYSIPLDAEWVYLNKDPNADGENYAYYYSRNAAGRANGKWQPRQIPKRAARNSDTKFQRVDKFRQDVKLVEAKMTQALVNKDDKWAAIAMMRVLGMRVGTRDGDPSNIGTMQLQRKHVSFNPKGNVAVIKYTAKKRTAVEYETNDPLIIGLLKARMKGTQESFLFKTNDAETIRTLKDVTGEDYQNHDFRRLLATERAAEQVALFNRRRRAPKTEAEFDALVKEIGDYVNFDVLKEKTKGVALKSYVDPRVFEKWRKNVAGK